MLSFFQVLAISVAAVANANQQGSAPPDKSSTPTPQSKDDSNGMIQILAKWPKFALILSSYSMIICWLFTKQLTYMVYYNDKLKTKKNTQVLDPERIPDTWAVFWMVLMLLP